MTLKKMLLHWILLQFLCNFSNFQFDFLQTTQGGAGVTTLCDQGIGALADVKEDKGLPTIQR